MSSILQKVIGLMLIVLMSCAAWAQTPTGTSTLRGQVMDEQGAVIPGARATIILPNGKQRSVVSNANGEFVIPNVAPGRYTFYVEFKGFQNFVKTDLVMPSNEPLQVTMTVASVAVETEVKSEASGVSVEPDQNLTATVLGEDFIQTLPDNEEDLQNFLQALAGPAAGGASGGQGGAQILVNGFSGGRLPPREAIQQIRINQNPFSAEYSRPGFGRIEIITKPGLDSWRGNFATTFRNSSLDARNAFAKERPDSRQETFFFNIGGPVIKKKMSVFFNGSRRQFTGESNVFARTLAGDYFANVAAPSHSTHLNLRADYLLTQKNTLNTTYSFFSSYSKNSEFAQRFGGGFGGFGGGGGFGFGGGGGGGGTTVTLPERASNRENGNHTLQIADTFIISSRLIHEARLQLQRETSDATAVTKGIAITVLDAFNGGGSTCCPSRSRGWQADFQDLWTYNYKKHNVKGGFQLQYERARDLTASNFNGTYTFSSLEQYRLAVDPTNPNPLATQFTISTGDPLLKYSQSEMAWFAQDDWRINQAFTLSFGLRHEFQTNLGDKMNFAPRLGIAWSPFKDRKTTIRGGGGIFYSRLNTGLYTLALRNNGILQQNYVLGSRGITGPGGGTPFVRQIVNGVVIPVVPDLTNASITSQTVRTLDPNLEAPYVINLSASVERQLPKGFVVTGNYIYTRGVHQFRSLNINAPDPLTRVRPDPTRPNVFQLESSANSVFNGLQVSVRRMVGRGFSIMANYTLSKTLSDADGPTSTPVNPKDLRSEWGRAFTDRRHALFVSMPVTLPRGFRLMPFVIVNSGTPFNITTGRDDNGDTVLNDRVPGIGRNADLPASAYARVANTGFCAIGSLSAPSVPTLPNGQPLVCPAGQTAIGLRDFLALRYPNGVSAVGPGMFNVNMNLSKTFSFGKPKGGGAAQGGANGGRDGFGGRGGGRGGGFGGGFGGGPMMMGGGPGGETGRYSLTFSVQATNLFNHVNYGQYVGTLGSSLFGQATRSDAARQLELSIRFGF